MKAVKRSWIVYTINGAEIKVEARGRKEAIRKSQVPVDTVAECLPEIK